MSMKHFVAGCLAIVATALGAGSVAAQDKIGRASCRERVCT